MGMSQINLMEDNIRTLSIQEKAMLEASENMTITEVARSFEIMPQSVQQTLCRAYFKLGVSSKTDAIRKAKELGIL